MTMRELLFRGQTRRYGERANMAGKKLPSKWVEGSGVFVGARDFSIIYEGIEKHSVYADTVGQWTGFTDRNGKRIYEGDVVERPDFRAEDGHGVVEWDDDGARFVIVGGGLTVGFDNYFGYELEVIGNRWDTPELLEGGQ